MAFTASSFSLPNNAIAPTATFAAAAIPCNACMLACSPIVSLLKFLTAVDASLKASLILPASMAIFVNSSVFDNPFKFISAIIACKSLNCLFSGALDVMIRWNLSSILLIASLPTLPTSDNSFFTLLTVDDKSSLPTNRTT